VIGKQHGSWRSSSTGRIHPCAESIGRLFYQWELEQEARDALNAADSKGVL
jgi:hypothetical protein